MSYGTRFLFKFESGNGIDYEIRIGRSGYSGVVKQRPLGQAPVLKREQNGAIHGTSLEIWAECQVDSEFTELYTPNPFEYSVDLIADGDTIWSGYVSPELYSEPDIAPPYNVQIIATDGLGELKMSDWASSGVESLQDTLDDLLESTGLSLSLNFVSALKATGVEPGGLLGGLYVDLSHLEGKTKYEVLESILNTLHATITQQDGQWVLVRETDIIRSGLTVAGLSGNLKVGQIGSLGAYNYWPVGQLESKVEPAKRKIVVTAPNHYTSSILKNPDMSSDANWTKSGTVSWTAYGHYYLVSAASATRLGSYLQQSVQFTKMHQELQLSVHAKNMAPSGMGDYFDARLDVIAILQAEDGTYYWPKTEGIYTSWAETTTPTDYRGAGHANIDVASEADFTYKLPAVPEDFGACTLTVLIGHLNYDSNARGTLDIMSAYLTMPMTGNGWQDVLHIANSARDEADEVELCISTVVSDLPYSPVSLMQTGIAAINNQVNIQWRSLHLGSQDLLKFMARDYALSVALPRVRKTGKINSPKLGSMPMFYVQGGVTYMVDTFSWDLLEDEFDMEMISIPAASITVESETTYSNIEQTSDGSYVAGGSGTSSSTSGGGGVSRSELELKLDKEIFEDLFEKVDVDGVSMIHAKYGLYTLEQLSAGGPGGSGTGGSTALEDLTDVLLTNPQSGQFLAYGLDSKWHNASFSSSDYYTSDQIDALLESYVTSTFLGQNYLTSTQTAAAISSALGSYYTKNDIDGKGYLVSSDLDSYYTKNDIDGKGYLQSGDLADYAKTSDLDGYVDKTSAQTITGPKSFSSLLTGWRLNVTEVLQISGKAFAYEEPNGSLNIGSGYADTWVNFKGGTFQMGEAYLVVDSGGVSMNRDLHINGKRIYVTADNTKYLEYDTTAGAWKIVGDVYATGQVSACRAGGSGSGSVDLTSVQSDIIPYSDGEYDLGTSSKKFVTAHVENIDLDNNTLSSDGYDVMVDGQRITTTKAVSTGTTVSANQLEDVYVLSSGTLTLPANPVAGRFFRLFTNGSASMNTNGKRVDIYAGGADIDSVIGTVDLSRISSQPMVLDFVYNQSGSYWLVAAVSW